MIVKVQGGGKVYANTGSCSDVVSYLQHEDAERLQAGYCSAFAFRVCPHGVCGCGI